MRLCSGIFSIAVLALPLHAQFNEKIDVTRVNVDVVVTASDGTPVHGLTRDDFHLFEDGVAQPITNFYAIENRVAAAAPAAGTTAQATVATPDQPRFRRKVLLLIDSSSISKHARDVTLARLEELINDRFRGGEYEWSIAAVGAHLGMVMPLTSDKQRIHDVLAEIRGGAARAASVDLATAVAARPTTMQPATLSGVKHDLTGLTNFGHNLDDRESAMQAKFTTEAIIGAARSFAAADGKKIILLLTDNRQFNDLALTYDTHYATVQRDLLSPNTTEDLPGMQKGVTTLRDRIIGEANASNVSIYVINPEGLVAPGDMTGKQMTDNRAMFWIADQTGGRLMPGNDIAASISQFESTSSNFYSLGFRPARDDGKYHKLTVKLAKPAGYELKYRAGYSNEPADTQLERTLRSPIALARDSTLPVTLTTETPEPQKQRGAMLVPFQARIPVSKLQFLPAGEKWNAKLDVYVSVFDDAGRNLTFNRFTTSATADSANPDPSGTFTYRNGILMRKGEKHRIVVAFRDRSTDAVGIAESVVRPE
jgi:VWFA-related protein